MAAILASIKHLLESEAGTLVTEYHLLTIYQTFIFSFVVLLIIAQAFSVCVVMTKHTTMANSNGCGTVRSSCCMHTEN